MVEVADAEEEVEEDVAAAAFRGAVAAGLVEEISPAGVPVAPLARGTFPAAAEAVGWLIPGTPHRAPERPLDNDQRIAQVSYPRPRGQTVAGPAEPIVRRAAGSAKDRRLSRVLARDKVSPIDKAPGTVQATGT